jgi:hypothetical protein
LAQYRLSSGTSATAMMAVAGSTWVIGATSTSPPPKRRRRLPVRLLPERPDPPVRVDSGAVRTEAVAVLAEPLAAAWFAAWFADWFADLDPASGAIPQVSQ